MVGIGGQSRSDLWNRGLLVGLLFSFFFSWTQHGSLFYLHVAPTKGLGVYTGFSVFVFGLGAGWSRINPMAHGEEN
jgi:Flp pilus assembly protein protease CpaA